VRQHLSGKEEGMMLKKGKSASFDAMVKFFIQNYNIPTKKDFENLQTRLDRIEELIKSDGARGRIAVNPKGADKKAPLTALETVHNIIKRSREGTTFKEIQAKTGYGDKKIRNVIFRLHKMGRIERKRRGVYIPS
jgi:Fic family protein